MDVVQPIDICPVLGSSQDQFETGWWLHNIIIIYNYRLDVVLIGILNCTGP